MRASEGPCLQVRGACGFMPAPHTRPKHVSLGSLFAQRLLSEPAALGKGASLSLGALLVCVRPGAEQGGTLLAFALLAFALLAFACAFVLGTWLSVDVCVRRTQPDILLCLLQFPVSPPTACQSPARSPTLLWWEEL